MTVRQTLKTIVITPGSVHLNENQTQPFTAAENDQFGNVLATPLKIKWAKTVGVGSISTSGMYTSPAGVGSAEIAAISGLVVGRATVKVTNARAAHRAHARRGDPRNRYRHHDRPVGDGRRTTAVNRI